VNDNFYRGIQQIFRGVDKVLLSSAYWCMAQVCTFCARSKFLNFILKARTWSHHCRRELRLFKWIAVFYSWSFIILLLMQN